ncbi:hypothetical protein BKA63DRAFT_494600 [Paraphoma chrysanthemicola]|nr:hypothetical protein BKA63DRAFT_494600 [Paraphoma chrysanthemicola]
MGNVSSTSTHGSFAIDGLNTYIQRNASERAELAGVNAANVGRWLGQLDDPSNRNGKRPRKDTNKASRPKRTRGANVRRGDFVIHNEVECSESEDEEEFEERRSRTAPPSLAVSNVSTQSNMVVLQIKPKKLVVLKISGNVLKYFLPTLDSPGYVRSGSPSPLESDYDDTTGIDSEMEAAKALICLSKLARVHPGRDEASTLATSRLSLEENASRERTARLGNSSSWNARSKLKRHASAEYLLGLDTPSTSSADLDSAMDLDIDDATDVSSLPDRPPDRVVPVFRSILPPLNKSPPRPATEREQADDLARAIVSQPDFMGRIFPESSSRTSIIGKTIFDKGASSASQVPNQPLRNNKKAILHSSRISTAQHAAPQPLAMNLHRTRGLLRNLEAVTISMPSADKDFRFTTDSTSGRTAAELDALFQPAAHPKPEPYRGPYLSYAAFGNMPRKGHATRLVREREKAQEEENAEVQRFVTFLRKANENNDAYKPAGQADDDNEETSLHQECPTGSCKSSMVWCPKEGRCMDDPAELTHDWCSQEVCELMSEWCPMAEWVVEAREKKENIFEENEKGNVMEWED